MFSFAQDIKCFIKCYQVTSGNVKQRNLISFTSSSFQVSVNEQMSTDVVRNERDAWVEAINKLCVDWKHKSQSMHLYEELKESSKFAETINECRTEKDREPEADGLQNNHGSVVVPPLPRPRLNVPVTLTGPISEPVCFLALPEPVSELKVPSTQVKPPEPDQVLQLASLTSLGSTSTLTPAPPMPPPLLKMSKLKPLTTRTKAFHWDIITQDKVCTVLQAYSLHT